jgi:hypothetical protein
MTVGWVKQRNCRCGEKHTDIRKRSVDRGNGTVYHYITASFSNGRRYGFGGLSVPWVMNGSVRFCEPIACDPHHFCTWYCRVVTLRDNE